MGNEAGSNHTAGVAAGKAALLARSSIWKSAIVMAPLAATALFIASGTQAQTSGSAPSSTSVSANGPVAPIETAAAARRKGPKIKEKEATNDRVANPPATTDPVTPAQTGTPVAPIDAPDAARSKGVSTRPKVLDAQPNARVADPAPAAEPVAAPEAARTGRPKERDKPASDTSRTGRPKERDDSVRTHTKRTRATTPSRGTNLLLPALGGAAAIAAIIVATSGNGSPASP